MARRWPAHPAVPSLGGGVSLTDSASTSGWVYDTAAGTISDGDWVLGVKADTARLSNGLSVTSLVSQGDAATVLDFAKAATDSAGNEFTVVKIESKVFNGNKSLTELYLPEGFYWFDWGTFQNCTSLRKVSPLFPESVENFSERAFENCPIEGDLRLGVGSREVNLSNWRCFSGNYFTTVTLGPNFKNKKIGNATFSESKILKQVWLDDQIEEFDWSVFYNCTTITNITPCLPKGLKSLGEAVFQGISSCRGTLEICTGDNSYTIPNRCFNGSGFDAIVFGEKFAAFSGNACFVNMANLRRIRFLCDAPIDFKPSGDVFDDNSYKLIVTVPNPEDNASWKAILEDATQVIPWADLDDEMKAKFHENFPNEKNPKGLIIANWSSTGATGAMKTLVNRWITYENKPGFVIRLR